MTKDSKPFDPVAAWQEMVQKWEIEINSWSGKFTESEQFGAMVGQASKMSLAAQKAMTDHMEAVLRSLNLPSKSQMDTIAERLDAIEESLDRLRLELGRNGAPPKSDNPNTVAPKRTRKPPQDKA